QKKRGVSPPKNVWAGGGGKPRLGLPPPPTPAARRRGGGGGGARGGARREPRRVAGSAHHTAAQVQAHCSAAAGCRADLPARASSQLRGASIDDGLPAVGVKNGRSSVVLAWARIGCLRQRSGMTPELLVVCGRSLTVALPSVGM